jgi:hypothetical protein
LSRRATSLIAKAISRVSVVAVMAGLLAANIVRELILSNV